MRCFVALCLGFALMSAHASDDDGAIKSVIGPRNPSLQEGAVALKNGDGRVGVEKTLLGLRAAMGSREEKTAHANLCAGFFLLGQPETALLHCNWVLERDPEHWRTYNNRALVYLSLERFEESEADIKTGQQLNPHSEKLKEVKGMYLDEVKPVVQSITIDDRSSNDRSAEPDDAQDRGQ